LWSILRTYLPLRGRPVHLAVVYTNVLLYQRIDKVDWGGVIGDCPVRLVVSHVVLDELDDKRYLGSERIMERARSATVPFDEPREQLEGRATLRCPWARPFDHEPELAHGRFRSSAALPAHHSSGGST
jgi:hypothetical protein